jgi:hypothetical protein
MFVDWFYPKTKKIGFEDMKQAIENPQKFIIINTISPSEQQCLIQHTIDIREEEKTINHLLDNYEIKTKTIIIYGRNSNDETLETKYKQLTSLGFVHVYLYYGGLFEWILLQDIYGEQEFPTTQKCTDILKFRPNKILT